MKITSEIMMQRFRDGDYERHPTNEEFKTDLFCVLGVPDNPKRDLMYRIAYDYGHSGGYQEIYNYALDLVELIK